ncbi:conserved hypothetical protein [Theileria equi strain WA]|uniref:Pre-mRNA-splicing factor SLU7 n=1 Tax=Theileria equi strain WA TaxID=1537102 RepID=L1LFY6_THEEQ|nr:conserved hypothetical protein [Theileria equi strain WA]EKX74342.1 conserved hypothetical protein [Theileria equi strain WA]|eukprot:XP_004833794.1 conserved hypothetical protein [Theileria equi strain WA]
MWMGKIGNKSAAFINHKHFHPGNYKNLEKVWLAEEKHKAEIKRLKEMKEKREEEIKISKIKRQLREQEELRKMEMITEEKNKRYAVTSSRLADNDTCGLILPESTDKEGKKKQNSTHKLIIQSQYREDCFKYGHTSVFGSYYDVETKAWGYHCCKVTLKTARCTKPKANADSCQDEPHNKTKESADISTSGSKRPHEDANTNKRFKRHVSGMKDAIDMLKEIEALE